MRVAKLSDVKVGITLFNQYGEWFVSRLENGFNDVWVIIGRSGSKLLFENEIKYYNVK